MAKLFSQRPSDIAPLDDCGEIFRHIFDRDIAAFGQGVHTRLDEVATSSNPSIAQAQRTREWERIMGGDEASAFRDVGADISPNARVVGRNPSDIDDEDEMLLEPGWVI